MRKIPKRARERYERFKAWRELSSENVGRISSYDVILEGEELRKHIEKSVQVYQESIEIQRKMKLKML
jgi:hypothetical protein